MTLKGIYMYIVVPSRVYVLSDKTFIFIFVKEIVLYTGISPLEAPLIL